MITFHSAFGNPICIEPLFFRFKNNSVNSVSGFANSVFYHFRFDKFRFLPFQIFKIPFNFFQAAFLVSMTFCLFIWLHFKILVVIWDSNVGRPRAYLFGQLFDV